MQMAAVVVRRVRVSRLYCDSPRATITDTIAASKPTLAAILAGIDCQIASRTREIVEVAVEGAVFFDDKNEVLNRLLGEARCGQDKQQRKEFPLCHTHDLEETGGAVGRNVADYSILPT